MPEGIIGIDTDAYKGGGKTLKMLAAKYGDPPVTWETTSREDGSGIALYRVPPGTRLHGAAGQGIDIIQYHHRYAVIWPSIHPDTGRMYDWRTGTEPAGIPMASDLPWLPDRWVKALAAKAGASEGTPFDGDVEDWLAGLRPGPMDPRIAAGVRRACGGIRSGRSCRHDIMVGCARPFPPPTRTLSPARGARGNAWPASAGGCLRRVM